MSLAISTAPKTLVDFIPNTTERSRRIARDAVLVVSFAVFTAILAQVKISLGFTPIPMTGQTLAVMLSGAALGWRRGALSMGVYWLAGMVMPFAWYAGGKHGWDAASGTTAGYLLGFVVAAAFVGYLAEKGQDRTVATSIPAMLAGNAIVYVLGMAWLSHKLDVPMVDGEKTALSLGVTPFLAGDLFKTVLAGVLTPTAWKVLGRGRRD